MRCFVISLKLWYAHLFFLTTTTTMTKTIKTTNKRIFSHKTTTTKTKNTSSSRGWHQILTTSMDKDEKMGSERKRSLDYETLRRLLMQDSNISNRDPVAKKGQTNFTWFGLKKRGKASAELFSSGAWQRSALACQSPPSTGWWCFSVFEDIGRTVWGSCRQWETLL